LGVVLYVLVCGRLPFDSNHYATLKNLITSGAYREIPFFISEDCTSLIKGMLTVDVEARFSMTDIINHKWLKFNSESTLNRNAPDYLLFSSAAQAASENANNNEQANETKVYKEFRNLIDKIGHM
jgi:serine/threonine protein kinase